METFTQKWAIASLLEDISEGESFYYTDFPLHITLAGVFKIGLNGDQIVQELEGILSKESSFEIEADTKGMFGPNKDVAVMKIKQSLELMRLYELMHAHLLRLGAVYNSPEHEGTGYIPHSTFQKSGKLSEGEKRHIKSVSLIDLLPNGDGYQRKVVKTFELRERS